MEKPVALNKALITKLEIVNLDLKYYINMNALIANTISKRPELQILGNKTIDNEDIAELLEIRSKLKKLTTRLRAKLENENTKKTLKYRDHRGSLAESMETLIEVSNTDEIINHLNEFYKQFGETVAEIKFNHVGFDERINWDTYNVLYRLEGQKDFTVAGMTNGCF